MSNLRINERLLKCGLSILIMPMIAVLLSVILIFVVPVVALLFPDDVSFNKGS